MAIFHYTVKIVGRSKGKSILSASAYLNGDVMKNEETGRISYYKNCELWRSEWAKVCNAHLSVDQQVDHRSYARQGKLEIPTIHEGADARKIDEKFQNGQVQTASWKVEENQIIKRQNALLKKIQTSFGKVAGALSQWKERLNDLRRKPGSHSHNGINDKPDRGTAEPYGRDDTGIAGTEQAAKQIADLEREIEQRKQSQEYRSIADKIKANRGTINQRDSQQEKSRRRSRGMKI